MKSKASSTKWLAPAALVLFSVIPLIFGALRLLELMGGAEITPANARFFASPSPVVVHIVCAAFFAILGVFQFVNSFRHHHPVWHRVVGRVLVGCGLLIGLSGLWMTLFYPHVAGTTELLYVFRLVFGLGMVVSITLGFVAIRQGNVVAHRAWMIRGYAIGLGAGTQVLLGMVGAILIGTPDALTHDLLMGAAWVINLAIAEWIIRRRRAPRVRPVTAIVSHSQTSNQRHFVERKMKKQIKWLIGAFIVIAIIGVGLVGYAMSTALHGDRPVGFQLVQAQGADGHPFALGVWYPTQAQPLPTTLLSLVLMSVARDAPISGRDLPLVVISHGNGGGVASHADLAIALASAGYVVTAPMHTGDNYADQSAVGSASWLSGRTQELDATIDYMLEDWQGHDHINPKRIGAFGFSAGGFTVLTAVGAQPDLGIVSKHCAGSPESVCELLRYVDSPLLNSDAAMIGAAFLPDARIKAAVVAAPGLGFTMVPHGLDNVRVPIQLWGADDDVNVPYATNIKLVREALGSRVEFHAVAGAGHFSFLTPCGLIAPPELCSDGGQFDRQAFHKNMNAGVIAFFEKTMKQP